MKRDENQNVEYKENWQDKYLAWICGYANAQGGTLYFGIEDETKKPVGVKDANSLMERKGSGFKKMFEDYESLSVNLGRRVPILESDTDFFRLTLPNLLFGFSDAQLVEAVDRSGYGESTPTVTPTVNLLGVRLLGLLKEHGELSPMELRTLLKIRDRADFNERYLRPCLAAGFIEQTIPDKPTSRFQKYRLTAKGHSIT